MAEYKVVDAEKLDAELASVADAIRTKGGTSESLTFPQGFVDAVGAIESGSGGTDEIENIIDQSGVLESTDGTATEKVEQLIDKAEYEKWLHDNITTIRFKPSDTGDITLDCSNIVILNEAFSTNASAKKIILTNTQNVQHWQKTFSNCKAETIETLDFSSATNTTSCFTSTVAVNMKFVAETIKKSVAIHSPNLSDESIESIIDGLATVETAQTLTLNATVKAKLTETQLATITSKNWSVA